MWKRIEVVATSRTRNAVIPLPGYESSNLSVSAIIAAQKRCAAQKA